jgi:ribosomal protein S18 acetylase RimI-like enzyme
MLIRLMTMDDYQGVYELWTNTGGVGLRSLDDSPEGIGKFLERNPRSCFVAAQGESLCGVILSGHDGRRGYIYHTAVKPECRRRGLGKALARAAEEALKREGIHKIALVAFTANQGGNRFWDALGFSPRPDLTYRNKSLNPDNA